MAEATLSKPRSSLTSAELAKLHGLHIASERPSIGAYIRQLWAYRHFIAAFSNAKVAAQFSTAGLGRMWQVLTPLANVAVYFLIFGLIVGTGGKVPNFIGYLCIGIFIFTFTQTVVQNSVKSITDHLGLIRALHFPRASLPLTVTLAQLQQMGASVVVLLGIILVTKEPVTWKWLLLIPCLLLQTLFNAGLALFVARLGSKIPDLKQLMPFVLRTWLYASGILYSIELFTRHLDPWLAKLLLLNPLLVFAMLPREALLHENVAHPMSLGMQWLVAVVWTVVALVVGFIYFWRGEREYGRG